MASTLLDRDPRRWLRRGRASIRSRALAGVTTSSRVMGSWGGAAHGRNALAELGAIIERDLYQGIAAGKDCTPSPHREQAVS